MVGRYTFVNRRLSRWQSLGIWLLCWWGLVPGHAQVHVVVDSVPTYTPAGAALYIAGTFNQWNPGSANHQLTRRPDSTWGITLPPGSGTFSFKLTRGSWASVEGNASGAFRPNRTYTYGNGDTLRLRVLSWEDLHAGSGGGGGGGGTANAQVQILTDTFWMPTLNRYRRLWLYLPPDYATAVHKRYPVIYMHDGQNLFNAATSFAGEWEVDECLSRLFAGGDYGAIVVGIDNGGSQRINEYSPWVHPQYGGGQGDAYLQFIVQTLKPYMDARYRTDSTRNGTWLWGSSMGGLISQYGAVKYQEIFSKVGVFSPSLWFDQRIMQQPSVEGFRYPVRTYLLAGALESSSMVAQVQQLQSAMIQAGFPAGLIQTVIRSDGQHSEWFWRREWEAGYRWLQGQGMATVGLNNQLKSLTVYPNPVSGPCRIGWGTEDSEVLEEGSLVLRDALGREVLRMDSIQIPRSLDLAFCPVGLYALEWQNALGQRSLVRLIKKP
jgi:metallo-beta-lactamase class B